MHKIFSTVFALIILMCSTTASRGASLDFNGRDAATVGLLVIDLEKGDTLVAENIGKAMMPASILKCVTTASALSLVGGDFRYETVVNLEGTQTGTSFKGNIVIRPSGDPTIESRNFSDSPSFMKSIISAIKARGINQIEGDIIFRGLSYDDCGQNPQWAIEDAGWGYGAGVYAFNYSDNTFNVTTATLKTTPDIPYADINTRLTDSGTEIVHGINSENYIISGKTIDKRRNTVTTTMNNPAEAFAFNLKQKLDSAGIYISEDIVEDAAPTSRLCVHYSPANIEIMRSLMYRSDNMMAEATLRSIARGQSRGKCIKAEREYWTSRGVNTSYMRVFDGSGLARSNRVTPLFMADVLSDMARCSRAEAYVSLFPRVGIDGTVKSLLVKTPLKGKLALKSGSVNGVQCYAGYKLAADGSPTHVVVIMVNNFFCPRADLRKAIEAFLLEMF